MNGHAEYLELLAASIDFGLTEEEVARLNYHLASCPECRRAANELRGQNAVIGTTPIKPLAPARSEQILRAALRKPATRPRWGMLAVAALLATLAGGVALAGLRLVDNEPTPSEPPPSQVAEASVPPSAAPVEESAEPGAPPQDEGPRVTPNPGDEESPPADPAKLAFPLPYSANFEPVRVAPALDDRLWVSVGRNRKTVLALLGADGRPLPDWPMSVPFAENCNPLAASDGSVRLICYYSEVPDDCEGICGEHRVFAYQADGQVLSGFPKSVPIGFNSGIDPEAARMLGDRLLVPQWEGESESSGERSLVEIGADGSLIPGARVPAPEDCCTIGPDGVAYGTTPVASDEEMTEVLAFDQNGIRPGWPVAIEGIVSMPAFGPGGELLFSVRIGEEGAASRVVRLAADGSPVAEPIDPGVTIVFGGEYGLLPPLVDADGNAFTAGQKRMSGVDRSGEALDGWPYDLERPLERIIALECPPTDTGCMDIEFHPPLMSPQSLVYLVYPPDESGDEGGRITVVNRDGTVRSGWPKTLQRPGAAWDSVTIGENRRAYAVAVEPEPGEKSSASILTFAPNGTQEWMLTIVEP